MTKNILNKYLHQSGTNKGKLNQSLLQTNKRPHREGDPHPVKELADLGIVFIRTQKGRSGKTYQRWGTVEQHQGRQANNLKHKASPVTKAKHALKMRLKRKKMTPEEKEAMLEANRINRRGKYKTYRNSRHYRRMRRITTHRFNRKHPTATLRRRHSKLIPDLNRTWSHDELLGADSETVRKHIESQFTDSMGWHNHGMKGWHIDHIIPCSSFDLSDPEEQKKCFHYTNLQPLWAFDNLSKGSRPDWKKTKPPTK